MLRWNREIHLAAVPTMWQITVLVCACCGSVSGCGGGQEVAPARGVVKREGVPVAGGKVLFAPLERSKSAFGQIQPDGTFVLTTNKEGDGAAPGRHRVTIVGDFEVNGQEVHLTCTAPADLALEVEAGKENVFEINVSKDAGWQEIADDE